MDGFGHLTSFFSHVLSPDIVPQAAQGLFSSVLFIPLIFNTLDYFQKAEDKYFELANKFLDLENRLNASNPEHKLILQEAASLRQQHISGILEPADLNSFNDATNVLFDMWWLGSILLPALLFGAVGVRTRSSFCLRLARSFLTSLTDSPMQFYMRKNQNDGQNITTTIQRSLIQAGTLMLHLVLMHWITIEDNMIWRVLATFAMMGSMSFTWKSNWVEPSGSGKAAGAASSSTNSTKKSEKAN